MNMYGMFKAEILCYCSQYASAASLRIHLIELEVRFPNGFLERQRLLHQSTNSLYLLIYGRVLYELLSQLLIAHNQK